MDEVKKVESLWSTLVALKIDGLTFFLIQMVFLLVLGLLLSLGIKLFFKYLLVQEKGKKKASFARTVFHALYAPVLAEIWFFICLCAVRLSTEFFEGINDFWLLNYAFDIGILAGAVWFSVRLLGKVCDGWLQQYSKSKSKNSEGLMLDPTNILIIRRVGLIFITIISALIGLGILKIPLSGLLTFGGITGAALAFASQSMIANFFGGLFIYFDRPFVIGDWISSPEKSLEGVVEHIGWRLTVIRSLDRRPIYVPNSIFTSTIVANPSRMTHRRINQNVTVSHADAEKLPEIMESIRQILRETPAIDQSCQNCVNLLTQDALNSSGISFNILAYSLVTESGPFKMLEDKILLQAQKIITAAEAKIAVFTH